jgi:hypothetical protein
MQLVDLELSLFDKILASLTEDQKQKLSGLSDSDSLKLDKILDDLIFNESIMNFSKTAAFER